MHRHAPLFAMALLIPWIAAHAAEGILPNEIDFGPLPNFVQTVKDSAAVTAHDFPNADTVLVNDLVRESYRPDGTSVSVDDEYTKILTEKGRHDNAMRSFYFDAAYSTVLVARAEIVKPDGRRCPVDVAQNGRVMIDSGQMGANIYDPNMKWFQLSLPGLEIGDLCHLTVLRRTDKARIPDTWADLQQLEDSSPIVNLTYEIAAPATRPLQHILLRDALSNTVVYATQTLPDGRTLHSWKATHVPQMFPEPNMPAAETVLQRTLLSTSTDWPTISRWYWNLCQPRLAAVTPEMRATVSNLIAHATNDDERIQQLYTFVSQNIRYLGLTLEDVAPGYEPHDVCLTFQNRAGVCRDKAALLVALLRLAGFNAYPVLINVGSKLDAETPVPWFNHAIVGIAETSGVYRLLDPTAESTRNPFPAYLCNRSYLVAHPTGEVLRVSSVHPADQNLVHINTHGKLAADGTLTLDTRIAFDGINDTAYRSHFARQKPDERRRFFEGTLKECIPGAELTAFELAPENPMDTTIPLTATLSCRVRHALVAGDDMTLLTLPWLNHSLGFVHQLLGEATLDERRYTYVTTLACGVEETLAITVESHALGAPVEMPAGLHMDRAGMACDMQVGLTNNVITGAFRECVTQPEFTPREYASLKQSLRDIEYASRERLLFAPADSSQADSRILSDDLHVEIMDAHAWTSTRTTVRQILTYAGKKRNSEIKLSFTPIWQTAEVQSATISNRDGSVRTVGPHDRTVMDADWVGSAPRYPVGQVRVATLPGVEVGSVIRTVTVRSQTNAPFFWLEHHFGSTDPVNEQSLEVVAPNTLALHPSVEHGDHVQQQIVSNATTTCYRWSATSLPATPPEDQLPPWRAFRASVLLSSGNWRDYANAVQSAFERAMTDQTSSVARAQQLTHGLHGDMAQLRAVRDYVAEAVREDGPDYFELPLSCLTPSDQTLADGYGHAADKSLLLTALLRARGFNARPILVGDDRHAISADFDPLWHSPQPHFFGDVLVKVALTNQTLYLGDTDQYAEPGATYHEKYHVLNDDGTYSLVDTAKKTSIENAWTLDLSSNGTARITLETRYFGTACGEFRKLYAEMPPEQRRRHFQELVSGISQSARPVGEPVTDLTAYPGRRVVTVDVPRYAVREGQTLTLLLPGAAVTPIPLRADQRISPLLISSLLHDVWSCRVLLPPETIQTPVLPPAGTWQLPASLGTVTCSTEIKPGARTSLVFHRDTQLGAAMIAPDLYPALLEMNRRMTHPGMKTVVIRLQ